MAPQKNSSTTLLLILLATCFIACKTSIREQKSQDTISELRHCISKLNIKDQQNIITGLPVSVVNALWKNRLEEAIAMSWNQPQKEKIKEILGRLSPEVFEDSSQASSEFQEYLLGWIQQSKKVFLKEDWNKLYKICHQLGEDNNTPLIQQGTPRVPPLPDCDCQTKPNSCPITICARTRPCHVNRCFWFSSAWCNGEC